MVRNGMAAQISASNHIRCVDAKVFMAANPASGFMSANQIDIVTELYRGKPRPHGGRITAQCGRCTISG
jgi:hypothetical protein